MFHISEFWDVWLPIVEFCCYPAHNIDWKKEFYQLFFIVNRKFRMCKWLCRRSSWRWRWTVDPDQTSLVRWGTSGLNMRPSPWRTCRNPRSGTSPRSTQSHINTCRGFFVCLFFCHFMVSSSFVPSLLIWLSLRSAIMTLWGRPSRRPMSPGGRFSPSAVKLMHWRTRWATNSATNQAHTVWAISCLKTHTSWSNEYSLVSLGWNKNLQPTGPLWISSNLL